MAEQTAGEALRRKFRAEQRALRAKFDARLAGGKHTYEKGMRVEQVLIGFLREHLPPRYGVARAEIVDSKGHIARQADVVVYDGHHAPLLQGSGGAKVFAAESVHAVIQVKPELCRPAADGVPGRPHALPEPCSRRPPRPPEGARWRALSLLNRP